MLIEVKTKVTIVVDNKHKKVSTTYLVNDEFFANAEYTVLSMLAKKAEEGTVVDYEIQSLRISPIKEMYVRYTGEHTFIATLRDIWTEDDGTEKHLKYKVLLWADNLTEANHRVQEFAKEGYEMLVEGIKQVEYEYLMENNEQ